MTIELREGAFYRCRAGHIYGPIKRDPSFADTDEEFFDQEFFDPVAEISWSRNGSYLSKDESSLDLIEEIPAPAKAEPTDHAPVPHDPERLTILDRFAIAALQGLLSRKDTTLEHAAIWSFEYAQACMAERERIAGEGKT